MASENYRAPSVAQSAELAEQQGQVIVHALADAYAAGAEGLQFGGLARMEALAAALAATGKKQVGEPEIEFQARLMDVKTDLPTENWRHSPTYDENPGRGTHYWVQFRKRYIYYTPPTQGIDLGQLERIRNELHAMSGQVPDEWIDPIVELQQDVQKLIDSQRDTSPGVGNG